MQNQSNLSQIYFNVPTTVPYKLCTLLVDVITEPLFVYIFVSLEHLLRPFLEHPKEDQACHERSTRSVVGNEVMTAV